MRRAGRWTHRTAQSPTRGCRRKKQQRGHVRSRTERLTDPRAIDGGFRKQTTTQRTHAHPYDLTFANGPSVSSACRYDPETRVALNMTTLPPKKYMTFPICKRDGLIIPPSLSLLTSHFSFLTPHASRLAPHPCTPHSASSSILPTRRAVSGADKKAGLIDRKHAIAVHYNFLK